MEAYSALQKADDVRTFPSINMPPPVTFKVHTGKSTFSKSKEILAENPKLKSQGESLPGLLRTQQKALSPTRKSQEQTNVFTGFESANMKFDVEQKIPTVYEVLRTGTHKSAVPSSRGVNQVDLTQALLPNGMPVNPVGPQASQRAPQPPAKDGTLEELRNYIVLMDQYSLHNFLIYEGRTLRDTPEFESFRRAYQFNWGAISSIVYQLEEFMNKNDVKLAIINGPRVFELAKLNLPFLKKEDLHSCITNIEQVQVQLAFGTGSARKMMTVAVTKIQSIIRMFLCVRRYKRKLKAVKSAIKIQSMGRLLVQRMRFRMRLKENFMRLEESWKLRQRRLKAFWMLDESAGLPEPVNTISFEEEEKTEEDQDKEEDPEDDLDSVEERNHRIDEEIAAFSKAFGLTTGAGKHNTVPPATTATTTIPSTTTSQQTVPPPPLSPLTPTKHINNNNHNDDNNDNTRSTPIKRKPKKPVAIFKNKRIVIFLPSLSTEQYLRLEYDYFHAMQNLHLTHSYLLQDENTIVLYITPLAMTKYQIEYHEKFLALCNISLLPKRLHFITPEISEQLPLHLSLAQQLWYSSIALNKIKHFIESYPFAVLLSSSSGWAEKRICEYLNIPFFGPSPLVSTTLTSRSYLKSWYIQNNINLPIGTHDLYSSDDVLMALTRLIAANLGVIRWIIRLNYDLNGESVVIFDVEKFPIVLKLRTEQHNLLGEKENVATWFSKPVQLSVRKRLLAVLKKEFTHHLKIIRRDIYPNWDGYCKFLKLYGGVIEAEPVETMGYLSSLAFITPYGEIEVAPQGIQDLVEDTASYATQGYIYPQPFIPAIAIEHVSQSIGKKLFQQFQVVGCVKFSFVVFWDELDRLPRLWIRDINFGASASHGAYGIVSSIFRAEMQQLKKTGNNLESMQTINTITTTGSLAANTPAVMTSSSVKHHQTHRNTNTNMKSSSFKFPMNTSSNRLNNTNTNNTQQPTGPSPWQYFSAIPEGRSFVYLPLVLHSALKSSQDDIFFKLCRMKGIAYDLEYNVGTLFIMGDTIVGGNISVLCMGRTRAKSLEAAVQTLSFVQGNFGLDSEAKYSRRTELLHKILLTLKRWTKLEMKEAAFAHTNSTTNNNNNSNNNSTYSNSYCNR